VRKYGALLRGYGGLLHVVADATHVVSVFSARLSDFRRGEGGRGHEARDNHTATPLYVTSQLLRISLCFVFPRGNINMQRNV